MGENERVKVRRARRDPGGSRRWRKAAASLGAAALLAVMGIWAAEPAAAAPGDPFPVGAGTVFVSQQDPTRLYTAEQTAAGSVSFAPNGPTSSGRYNAMGFREADRYLYAIRQSPSGSRNLLRIGQAGQVSALGPVSGLPVDDYNQGTFGTGAYADVLFVRPAQSSRTMFLVDVDTVTATTLTLDAAVPNVSDLFFHDGFVWGVYGEGRSIYRIDPVTGAVAVFSTAGLRLPADPYGAQWVYGNGNVGVSNNMTGRVYQIHIDGGAGSSPAFSLISSIKGPASTNNDGAADPGRPADLSIVKSTAPTFTAGGAIVYAMTVTNAGPGASSGWIVADDIPASISAPRTDSPGCAVVDSRLTCAGGPLAAGESVTVTFTGATAPGTTECITNTATVVGNEADPNVSDDVSAVTTCPDETGTLTVTKALAGDATGDVPSTTSFDVDYSYTAAGVSRTGTLTLVAGGSAELTGIPSGAVVDLSEAPAGAIPGDAWGSPSFSGRGVALTATGARVTVSAGTTTAVTLTNTITHLSSSVGGLVLDKTVDGDGAGDLPEGTTFEVAYSYAVDGVAQTGTLSVAAGGSAALSGVPVGTLVELSETAPAPVAGDVWASPEFSGDGVTATAGGARVTIGAESDIAVHLRNTITRGASTPARTPTPTAVPTPAQTHVATLVRTDGWGAFWPAVGAAALIAAGGTVLVLQVRRRRS